MVLTLFPSQGPNLGIIPGPNNSNFPMEEVQNPKEEFSKELIREGQPVKNLLPLEEIKLK